MSSSLVERAIREVTKRGTALVKFISANDAGATGAHQAGFYLPKSAWQLYSAHAPVKGKTLDESVEILWHHEQVTQSRITWYGDKTRSEYRLTRFGRRFPFLNEDRVGDLFMLVPEGKRRFCAYVLDSDDDIADVLNFLGLDLSAGWAIYHNGSARLEAPENCVARACLDFARSHSRFPTGDVFSDRAAEVLDECHPELVDESLDERLLRTLDIEYRLFRAVERSVCAKDIGRPFADVDDFLRVASTIMNRRKSRAGRSLENHVSKALERSGIPFDLRVREIQGAPDLVIPSVDAYFDPAVGREKVFVVAAKTTCKDRWRQVLNEAPLAPRKYLLTTQPGISDGQVREMTEAKVALIVPQQLHSHFPPKARARLMTVRAFVDLVQNSLEG